MVEVKAIELYLIAATDLVLGFMMLVLYADLKRSIARLRGSKSPKN